MNSSDSIKDMMRKGATAEDLMKLLQRDIDKAKSELEAERQAELEKARKAELDQEKEKKLSMWRREVIKTIARYLEAMGVLEDTNISLEAMNEMISSMKEFEKNMLAMRDLAKEFEKLTAKRDAQRARLEKNLSDKENFCVKPDQILKDYINNIM